MTEEELTTWREKVKHNPYFTGSVQGLGWAELWPEAQAQLRIVVEAIASVERQVGLMDQARKMPEIPAACLGLEDRRFRALLDLAMCCDPWPVDDAENQCVIKDFLDEEARARGFEDWIDAYHRADGGRI